MVTWLRRQEATHTHHVYILWRQPELSDISPATDHASTSDDDLESADADLEPFDSINPSTTFQLTKTSPLPHLSVSTIQDQFKATSFTPTLAQFLNSQHPTSRTGPFTYTDVFKQVVLRVNPRNSILPPFRDRIRCTHATGPGVLRSLSHRPCFDTALIKNPPGADAYSLTAVHHSYTVYPFLLGSKMPLCIGRVRTIFKLRDPLRQEPVNATDIAGRPLAYVEWFTELGPVDGPTKMYVVKRTNEVEVLPVSRFVRSCHLIANLGLDDDFRVLDPDDVLDVCSSFQVNDFLDLHSYLIL